MRFGPNSSRHEGDVCFLARNGSRPESTLDGLAAAGIWINRTVPKLQFRPGKRVLVLVRSKLQLGVLGLLRPAMIV